MTAGTLATLGVLLVLALPILADDDAKTVSNQTYAFGGADWTADGCVNSPNLQSPMNIETQFAICQSRNVVDLVWNSLTTENITITLSGDPLTVRVKVARTLLSLLYKRPGVMTKVFFPEEMVFRTPSEHTIRGVQYPLELQIFLVSTDDTRVAFSILFAYSNTKMSSSVFRDFIMVLNQAKNLTTNATIKGTLNYSFEYKNLFPFTIPYYQYNGTLTDQNCPGDVQWIVYASTLPVSTSDLSTYQSFLNASTVAATNSRKIQLSGNRPIHNGGVTCNNTYDRAIWFTFVFGAMVFFVFKML